MPVLGQVKTKKIILLSTKGSGDEAWVEITTELGVADSLEAEEKQTQKEKLLFILSTAIKDWNFTGKDGKKSPITIDNVGLLNATDLISLSKEIKVEGTPLDKSKKKP